MSAEPEDTCCLCPTTASTIAESAVPCFDPAPFTPTTSNSIKYTVAEILNKHFWFELHSERDANTFICQPCWRKVLDFHLFYQSVLMLHNSRTRCWQPQSHSKWNDDVFVMEIKPAVLVADDDEQQAPDNGSESSRQSDNSYCSRRTDDSNDSAINPLAPGPSQISGEVPTYDDSTPPKRKRCRSRISISFDDSIKMDSIESQPDTHNTDAVVSVDVKHEDPVNDTSTCDEHNGHTDNHIDRRRDATVLNMGIPLDSNSEPQFSVPTPKRKRGRPRKSDQIMPADYTTQRPADVVGELEPHSPVAPPAQRKRGRPRKNETIGDASIVATLDRCRPSVVGDDLIAQYFSMHCDLCAEPVATLAAARTHYQQEHQQRGYLSCFCGRRYARIDGLREHCAFHADTSPYKCLLCCKIFCSEQRLLRHQTSMHADARASERKRTVNAATSRLRQQYDDELLRRHIPLVCGECGMQCDTFAAFSQHHWTKHGRRGFVVCCGRKFARKHRALLHCRRWHTNAEPFHGAIRHHMHEDSAAHQPTISGYQCYRCKRLFKYVSFLRHHLLDQHQSPDEYRYECVQCHTRISSMPALRRHQRKCTTPQGPSTQRPATDFVCDICGKVLRKKVSYDVHYAMEHSADGGESLRAQCPECGKWLKHYRRLAAHMLKHKATPERCPECGKMTPNRSALHQHRRVMHREPAHQCTACGRKFRLLVDMRKHMNIHTRAHSARAAATVSAEP